MDDTERIGSSTAPPASHFPTTRPSLVLQAAHGDPETAARAIRELCAIYHEPIRNWLARNLPQVRERDDAVQGFVEYLLQQNRLHNFQWGAAKFRSFPIKCLKWYLRGGHRKGEADKRGGRHLAGRTGPSTESGLPVGYAASAQICGQRSACR